MNQSFNLKINCFIMFMMFLLAIFGIYSIHYLGIDPLLNIFGIIIIALILGITILGTILISEKARVCSYQKPRSEEYKLRQEQDKE
jgi:membrane protein YdbS with pleckstrin-like domain